MTSNEGRDSEACRLATICALVAFAQDYWGAVVAGVVLALVQRFCGA